jgi:hypothetical protein
VGNKGKQQFRDNSSDKKVRAGFVVKFSVMITNFSTKPAPTELSLASAF